MFLYLSKNCKCRYCTSSRQRHASIYGLDEVMAGELVEFEEGTTSIALNLELNNVGVVLMGDGLLTQEESSQQEELLRY